MRRNSSPFPFSNSALCARRVSGPRRVRQDRRGGRGREWLETFEALDEEPEALE